MKLLALDPGSSRSALVGLESCGICERPGFSCPKHPPFVVERLLAPNAEILEAIAKLAHAFDVLAIEWIESYGMPVGAEVFHTCRWVGRFEEQWSAQKGGRNETCVHLVPRRTVKLALCGSARAKDSNIRAALLDLYGGREATHKGGPLYGIKADLWSALAVGIVAMQQQESD